MPNRTDLGLSRAVRKRRKLVGGKRGLSRQETGQTLQALTLIEASPLAIITVDAQGMVKTWNPAAERIFGWSASEIIERRLSIVPKGQEIEFPGMLKGTLEGKSIRELETRRKRKNGTEIEVCLSAAPLRDNSGKIIGGLAMITDITERKRTEQTLLMTKIAIEQSVDGIAVADLNGNIRFVNPAWAQMHGFAVGELLGKPLRIFHTEEQLLRDVIPFNEKVKRAGAQQGEVGHLKKDGTTFSTWMSTTLLKNERGDAIGLVGIARDITERKWAEKELKDSRDQLCALARRLQKAREEEDILIAREIHDQLGQNLTVLKMEIAELERHFSPDQKPLLDKTQSMAKLIDSIIKTVRRISSELRPEILDGLGLTTTLEREVRNFENRTGIKCEPAFVPEEISLDKERSVAIFRILQETLTNVMRHAQATKVKISLIREEDFLILEVKDNGKGIEFGQALDPNSLGIIGLKERALQFGGKVNVTGSPGKGTTVTVRIPLGEVKEIS